MTVALPSDGELTAGDDLTTVFEGRSGSDSIAVEAVDAGFRSLIYVKDSAAPQSYNVAFGGDVAALEPLPDGSIATLDSSGNISGVIELPWAIDAEGVPVPTEYSVDGLVLTQTVDHTSGVFAYPIVADPWWNPFSWPWGTWVRKTKSVVGSALRKCGAGALVATIGLGVGTGSTNVLIEKFGKGAKIKAAGGPWGYVGAATAGCIIDNL